MTTEQARHKLAFDFVYKTLGYPMGLRVLLASQLFVWVRDRLTQDC